MRVEAWAASCLLPGSWGMLRVWGSLIPFSWVMEDAEGAGQPHSLFLGRGECADSRRTHLAPVGVLTVGGWATISEEGPQKCLDLKVCIYPC